MIRNKFRLLSCAIVAFSFFTSEGMDADFTSEGIKKLTLEKIKNAPEGTMLQDLYKKLELDSAPIREKIKTTNPNTSKFSVMANDTTVKDYIVRELIRIISLETSPEILKGEAVPPEVKIAQAWKTNIESGNPSIRLKVMDELSTTENPFGRWSCFLKEPVCAIREETEKFNGNSYPGSMQDHLDIMNNLFDDMLAAIIRTYQLILISAKYTRLAESPDLF